jgi:single-stranded DNA-binding protein
MARNNHYFAVGDLTGDIYYDTFTLDNAPVQYLRLYVMIKGVQGAAAVKGLRVCVYGPLAELTYGHVHKGSRIAFTGHIQTRQTKIGKAVFEIVAEEVEYLRNIDWETGQRVRDDLVKRGELRSSYFQEPGNSVSLPEHVHEDVREDELEISLAGR